MTTVNFCPECDSLYFIQHTADTNTLNYICKNCGSSEECTNHLIHDNDFKKNHKLSYVEELIKNNKDLINDPSIPRIKMVCKNKDCLLEQGEPGEQVVSLIKYDDTNLLFIYICTNCKNYWTNTD